MALNKAETILLLRWLLIIATSYLVLFSRPLAEISPPVAVFVALYLGSNLILSRLLPQRDSVRTYNLIVLFDSLAVCVGLALVGTPSADLFVVYFVVLFLSALTERIELVVGAAVLISVAHLFTSAQYLGFAELMRGGRPLQVPFLFVVSLFFGHLVQESRRRQRAAQEAHDRAARMEFVSAVSHDIRNPLGVIQLLTELLLDGDGGTLSPQQTDVVRRMHASVRHLVTLTLNLIDATRCEGGHLMLNRSCASLADVAADAVLLAQSSSALKGITLQCSFAPDVPPVNVDVVQMERVISNLLDNAVKFTPRGGRVALTLSKRDEQVVLTVEDSGLGIPSDEIPQLFEKYHHRAPGRVEGSGLGLFIVKAVIDAHGGSVVVRSTVGTGTTVTVELPSRSGEAAVNVPEKGGGRRVAPLLQTLSAMWPHRRPA